MRKAGAPAQQSYDPYTVESDLRPPSNTKFSLMGKHYLWEHARPIIIKAKQDRYFREALECSELTWKEITLAQGTALKVLKEMESVKCL